MPRAKTSRQNLKPKAQYDAAGQGRRLTGWNPSTQGPNRALKGIEKVRDRSHDLVQNDWTGEAAVTKWATTLIGIGITARFEKIKSKARRKVLAEMFADFVRESDADGVNNLFGQQTLAIRTWMEGGECFVRERARALTLPLTIPVQFQMLEGEFLPYLDADTWPGMPAGNRICQGIELNNYDRRIAYWFYKSHPGDGLLNKRATSDQLVRVPASEVWHIYEQKRPGQLRGAPMLAPVMIRLRMTGDFEDAVLDRQRLANLFVTFLTKTLPPEAWEGMELDSLTGLPLQWTADGSPMSSLEPGTQQELMPGEDVKFANPPEAGVTHSDYLRSTTLGSAAGAGIPYELLSGDIANVSDRTLRVLINEFRRLAEQRQWQVVIPMFCQRAVEAFARFGYLAGKITLAEIELIKRCTHAPHGWAYIHPVQDVQGKKLEIEAGISARSDVISAKGDDPEEIDDKRAEDLKRANSLGLNDPTPSEKLAAQKAAAPVPAQ